MFLVPLRALPEEAAGPAAVGLVLPQFSVCECDLALIDPGFILHRVLCDVCAAGSGTEKGKNSTMERLNLFCLILCVTCPSSLWEGGLQFCKMHFIGSIKKLEILAPVSQCFCQGHMLVG
jgi:hypothetical protein